MVRPEGSCTSGLGLTLQYFFQAVLKRLYVTWSVLVVRFFIFTRAKCPQELNGKAERRQVDGKGLGTVVIKDIEDGNERKGLNLRGGVI